MKFVFTVKLKDHNFYILRSLKSGNWQILNFVYSSLGNMDFFYYKCQISKYLILCFAKLEIGKCQSFYIVHWVKYGFFLYYKSHFSKFLYFESYKFWKLANIKVSTFCSKKNLEFVFIINFKHQKVSIWPRAKPGNCSTESLSIGYGLKDLFLRSS